MKVSKITSYLLNKYPLKNQEEWDNSGLITNAYIEDDIQYVGIALDVSLENLKRCQEEKINLLITHHPITILKEEERLSTKLKEPYFKEMNKILIDNRITVLSLHTNFDVSNDGMNTELARLIGLREIQRLDGYSGVIGITNNSIQEIQKILKPNIFITNTKPANCHKTKKIYIGGGACSSEIEALLESDIRFFISSEIKWHLYVKANDLKKTLIDVGHNTEKIFITKIKSILKAQFSLKPIAINPLIIKDYQNK